MADNPVASGRGPSPKRRVIHGDPPYPHNMIDVAHEASDTFLDALNPIKGVPQDIDLPMEKGQQIDPRILEHLFGPSLHRTIQRRKLTPPTSSPDADEAVQNYWANQKK